MKPFSIVEIAGALYLSNKVWPSRDLPLLRALGIGAIVNLCRNHHYDAPEGIACLARGLPDGAHVPSAALGEIYEFIARHRARTGLLVHCAAGVSRSAGVVVGQLLLEDPRLGWDDALRLVSARRSVWVSVETRDSVRSHLAERAGPPPFAEVDSRDLEALRRLERSLGVSLAARRAVHWDTRGFVVEGGRVVGLGLCGLGLTSLPAAVLSLDRLRELSLCDNALVALPDGVIELPELQRLDVSGNRLAALPPAIGSLARLEILGLARNALETLPDELGRLCALRELHLHANGLRRVDDALAGLHALRELSLQRNALSSLPGSIGALAQLRVLSLEGNALETLPGSIAELSGLAILSLANNRLGQLPAAIAELTSLDNLNLSGNELAVLPDEIQRLRRLRRLNLALNPLRPLSPRLERWLESLARRGCVVIREGVLDGVADTGAERGARGSRAGVSG